MDKTVKQKAIKGGSPQTQTSTKTHIAHQTFPQTHDAMLVPGPEKHPETLVSDPSPVRTTKKTDRTSG